MYVTHKQIVFIFGEVKVAFFCFEQVPLNTK